MAPGAQQRGYSFFVSTYASVMSSNKLSSQGQKCDNGGGRGGGGRIRKQLEKRKQARKMLSSPCFAEFLNSLATSIIQFLNFNL